LHYRRGATSKAFNLSNLIAACGAQNARNKIRVRVFPSAARTMKFFKAEKSSWNDLAPVNYARSCVSRALRES